MTAFVFLSLGCIFEAVATPIEKAINRPKSKVYRKRNNPRRYAEA